MPECPYHKDLTGDLTDCQIREAEFSLRLSEHDRRLRDGDEKFDRIMTMLHTNAMTVQRLEQTLNNGIKTSLEKMKGDMESLIDSLNERKRLADNLEEEARRRLGIVESDIRSLRTTHDADQRSGVIGFLNNAWKQFLDKFSWVIIFAALWFLAQWIISTGGRFIK